nr:bifunctional TH2 protein, mitochondrial [Ipomoea batatas]
MPSRSAPVSSRHSHRHRHSNAAVAAAAQRLSTSPRRRSAQPSRTLSSPHSHSGPVFVVIVTGIVTASRTPSSPVAAAAQSNAVSPSSLLQLSQISDLQAFKIVEAKFVERGFRFRSVAMALVSSASNDSGSVYCRKQKSLGLLCSKLELAEANAEDDDAKLRIRELRKTTLDKLNLHHDSLAQNRATTKCTEFLLATATGKHATPCEKTKLSAYTLGAVTSCIRLYAYIGKELQGLIDGKSNHRYKKWIENYSSDNFQVWLFLFSLNPNTQLFFLSSSQVSVVQTFKKILMTLR